MQVLNPAWKAFNDLHNEGGEGYNPHPKWIARQAAPVAVKPAVAAASGASKYVKDERGNTMTAAKMAERLAKDEACMLRITDASARSLTQARIDFARAALA